VDRDNLRELLDAPEDSLSFHVYSGQIIESRYTFGEHLATSHYYGPLIRTKLSPKIGSLMPDIIDEFISAFEDEMVIGDGMAHVSQSNYRLDTR
jgi:hypothetical protein